MFDISKSRLVYESVATSPGDKKPYGWVFNMYEPASDDARPLFFSHLLELMLHARKTGADVCWAAESTPQRVTAFEYIKNYDAQRVFPPDIQWGDTSISQKLGRYHKGLKEATQAQELDDDGASFESWADEPGISAGSPWDEEES